MPTSPSPQRDRPGTCSNSSLVALSQSATSAISEREVPCRRSSPRSGKNSAVSSPFSGKGVDWLGDAVAERGRLRLGRACVGDVSHARSVQ